MLNKLTCRELWQVPEGSVAYGMITEYTYPWEVVPNIKKIILEIGATLGEGYKKIGEDIWISESAKVSDSAEIHGPAIIMDGAEVRHSAFIRGSALIGRGAVLGNSCEVKNAILFDLVQVPHFNYVGDSILGYRAHTGAGAITSNVKSDKTPVTVSLNGYRIETGLKKLGALLGDYVEVGCNSVMNPGTVIGRHTNVYPLSSVRGYIPENSIFKSQDNIVTKKI